MRNPRLLKPFGLPTERLLTEHRAAVRRLGALPPSLRGVAAFDDASARGGLIPRGLAGALAELGMDEKEAQGMADEIPRAIQTGIVDNYRARCRTIAEDREQKTLYRKHVLGLPSIQE